jgi:hypothetical protein
MFKTKGEKVIRSVKRILIGSFLLFIGCSNPFSSENRDEFATIKFDMRLSEDSNGYYHLTVDRGSWQTIHRVSGSITQDGFGVENFRVDWVSNLYWYMGDTLGYVVKRGLNWNLEYVSYDTVYITGFTGHEVPTSNQVSLSNGIGEFNNMIAPVKTMVGDTMKLTADWYGGNLDFYIVLD